MRKHFIVSRETERRFPRPEAYVNNALSQMLLDNDNAFNDYTTEEMSKKVMEYLRFHFILVRKCNIPKDIELIKS
jgi:hypothetical protein